MPDAALGGNLPKGDANGLGAIASELITEPARPRVLISIIDTAKVTTKTDTGDRLATVRIRRVEAVLPEDLGAAEKLMRRALEKRTGSTVLPLDLEDELTAAFEEFDPAEPEEDADPGDQAEPGDAEEGGG